jgi:hypothetical protein
MGQCRPYPAEITGVGCRPRISKDFWFLQRRNAGCDVSVSRIRLIRRGGLVTEVARITLTNPYRGTMAAFAAYIPGIEGFMA